MAKAKTKEPKRNYENEHKWAAQKYKRFEAKLEREMGEDFAQFLSDSNTTFTDWVRDNFKKERNKING